MQLIDKYKVFTFKGDGGAEIINMKNMVFQKTKYLLMKKNQTYGVKIRLTSE